ncbi:hypothetical protein ACJMK2_034046 [Sinanodonta woodiana]|uniref:Cyclin-dependent kinase 2-associated protein n=1 Tax=Sinanodonta woodiana TaxID=1069815 RepID=A0ABD3WUI9_SINWO
MEDESTIESRASNSPITPSMSNPGTPRSDVASEVNATAPPQPGQQQHRQQHQLQQQQQQLLQQQMQQQLLQQQQSQSKYSQLLAVIEDMGRDIRPTYSGSRTSAERLKRGIVHARILVRECLMECERSARA